MAKLPTLVTGTKGMRLGGSLGAGGRSESSNVRGRGGWRKRIRANRGGKASGGDSKDAGKKRWRMGERGRGDLKLDGAQAPPGVAHFPICGTGGRE